MNFIFDRVNNDKNTTRIMYFTHFIYIKLYKIINLIKHYIKVIGMFNYAKHILKILKEEQQGHPILKHFVIKYPSKEIAQHQNCIFVGFTEAKATAKTHHSQQYDEMIDIVITTKQLDYKESAKIYDAVTNILLNIFRKDDVLKDKMSVISFMHKYNADNTLQFGELLLSFKTVENYNEVFDIEDEDLVYDIVCSIKGYADD